MRQGLVKLLKLADYLETKVKEEKFRMSIWGTKKPDCGFSGCAMGWAAQSKLFPGLKLEGVFSKRDLKFREGVQVYRVTLDVGKAEPLAGFNVPVKLFGIEHEQAFELFSGYRMLGDQVSLMRDFVDHQAKKKSPVSAKKVSKRPPQSRAKSKKKAALRPRKKSPTSRSSCS